MANEIKVIGGFILGAAVGTAAGMLMAPDSGKKTRKLIMNKTSELTDELTDNINKSLESAKKNYNEKVDEYTKTGHKALDNIKESVKTH